MITIEELKKEISAAKFPKNWRKGQSVFNYIDNVYGVARNVQFEFGIDCFYNNDCIDDFIDKAVELINKRWALMMLKILVKYEINKNRLIYCNY